MSHEPTSSELTPAEMNQKYQELEDLRQRVEAMEHELAQAASPAWEPPRYYAAYFATTGFMLGIFGAAASLLYNIIGSLIVDQAPLKLIQIYLTFPLGAKALQPGADSGLMLAIGCCLYLGTGMLLGIPVHMLLARFTPNSSVVTRLVFATVIGLAIWGINFYGILSWLQPLLIGGNWIVEMIPPWVAASTHVVFAWTMALFYPLGKYTHYRTQTELL